MTVHKQSVSFTDAAFAFARELVGLAIEAPVNRNVSGSHLGCEVRRREAIAGVRAAMKRTHHG